MRTMQKWNSVPLAGSANPNPNPDTNPHPDNNNCLTLTLSYTCLHLRLPVPVHVLVPLPECYPRTPGATGFQLAAQDHSLPDEASLVPSP